MAKIVTIAVRISSEDLQRLKDKAKAAETDYASVIRAGMGFVRPGDPTWPSRAKARPEAMGGET